MLKFSKLTQYQLLELQNDLEKYFILKKNNYISDLTDEEINDVKYYQRLFKRISNELEEIDV